MSGMLFDGKNEAKMNQATKIEGGVQSSEVIDITDVVHPGESSCLNENKEDAPFSNLFESDPALVLRSDADEQLLMTFAFKEPVKLHSLDIVSPIDDSAPQNIKIYVNRLNMGFDDCDGTVPSTQEVALTPALLAPGVPLPLNFIKFQRVNQITIFVEDNNGAEETVLSSIKFFGNSTSGTKTVAYGLQPGQAGGPMAAGNIG